MNNLADLNYSIIANRKRKSINLSNKASNKACRKIYRFLHLHNKHISDKNYVHIWRTLVAVGILGNFNMSVLLYKNFANNSKAPFKNLRKRHRRKKLHCYISKQLSIPQWKDFILYVLKLIGISEHELAIYRNKSIKIAKHKSVLYKAHKRAIRYYNLYKVELSFFRDHTAMTLTRWQIEHINMCTLIAGDLQSIKHLSKGLLATDEDISLGGFAVMIFDELYELKHNNALMTNKVRTKVINYYCGTHFTISQFKSGHPYIVTTNKISQLKSGAQWYQIFTTLLKTQYPTPDSNYIFRTLNGDKSLYHQYKYQVRYLDELDDQGIPIKGDYNWYYRYDSDRSGLKSNPARTFYHYHKDHREREIKRAIAFAKANHVLEAVKE